MSNAEVWVGSVYLGFRLVQCNGSGDKRWLFLSVPVDAVCVDQSRSGFVSVCVGLKIREFGVVLCF